MNTKMKLDDLRASYMAARSQKKKDEVFELIRAEMDIDAEGVVQAVLTQITETNERARERLSSKTR